MVNFGPLAAQIGTGVSGTPVNFNGFRVFTALLYGTLVVGVGQTLRRWTEDATYIRQGGHHVGHWTHILVEISHHNCRLYIKHFSTWISSSRLLPQPSFIELNQFSVIHIIHPILTVVHDHLKKRKRSDTSMQTAALCAIACNYFSVQRSTDAENNCMYQF